MGVGKSAGRGKVLEILISRGESEVIEVGVAPVSLQLDDVLAGSKADNSAGGLRESGRIGECDLALVNAVDVEVLHLLVGIGWLTVSNGEFVETIFGNFNFHLEGSALLVEVSESAAGAAGEIGTLRYLVLIEVGNAVLAELSALSGTVLEFILENVFSGTGTADSGNSRSSRDSSKDS